MKVLRHFISQRLEEILHSSQDPQTREELIRKLFLPKITPKVKWLESICVREDITENSGFQAWLQKQIAKHGTKIIRDSSWMDEVPAMTPSRGIPLPRLATVGELASFLQLSPTELAWYADLHQRSPSKGPLQHYHHRWIPKHRGHPRLLMEPKESLKVTQKKLLRSLVDHIPLHDSAHGFQRHHSIKTYSEPHTDQRVVLHLDLADFFPSITFPRVRGLFQSLGYSNTVARYLAALSTHSPPKNILNHLPFAQLKRLSQRHLPQGAPTSPALANATSYRLDSRLSGLAESANLHYSRYADDLAFSGDRIRDSFINIAGAIILEEGFLLNTRKTRLMHASSRQHLTGVTINKHPNISRTEFDRLKAIIHNCRIYGPLTQDHQNLGPEIFRQHLRGKIAALQMLNPDKGEKLLNRYYDITW